MSLKEIGAHRLLFSQFMTQNLLLMSDRKKEEKEDWRRFMKGPRTCAPKKVRVQQLLANSIIIHAFLSNTEN